MELLTEMLPGHREMGAAAQAKQLSACQFGEKWDGRMAVGAMDFDHGG